MTYKLEYPYTEKERVGFIDENNYNGHPIYTVDNFIEETKTEEVTEERDITEEREITETREVVNEETGEITYEEVVVGTETVVVGTETITNVVEVGTEMVNYPTYYALEPNEIWDEETQQPIIDKDYEEKQKAKEKARIAEISLTRADVFEALILARGLTKQMLRSFIEQDETLSNIEKALYLNRFDDALEFYRKHPAIDFISAKLGISPDDMDKFFDTKDYTYLVTTEQVTNQVTNQVEEVTDGE